MGFMEHINVTKDNMSQQERKYLIPVYEKDGKLNLDSLSLDIREQVRSGFTEEENTVLDRMNNDAKAKFEKDKLKDDELKEYATLYDTPYGERIYNERYKGGSFYQVWSLLTALLDISDDEAIRKYCMVEIEKSAQPINKASFIVPVYINDNGALQMRPLKCPNNKDELHRAFEQMARDCVLKRMKKIDWRVFEQYIEENGYDEFMFHEFQGALNLTEQEALERYFTSPEKERDTESR